MQTRLSLVIAGMAAGLMWVVLPVSAQVLPGPTIVNVQGRLSAANGDALADGTHTITVSLWDAAAGGSQKFSQTLPNIAVKDGVFSAPLTMLTPGAVNGALWVQFQVDGDAGMAPRLPLASVATALKANTVPDSSIGSPQLAMDGGSLLRVSGGAMSTDGANVALTSGSALSFADNGLIRSLDNNHGIFFRRSENILELREFGNILLTSGALGANPTPKVTVAASGNVGIGTNMPTARLEVQGGALGTAAGDSQTLSDQWGTTTNAVHLKTMMVRNAPGADWTSSSLVLQRVTDVSPQAFIALNGNNVGIGTSTPTTALEVNGEVTAKVITVLGGSDVAEPYDVSAAGDARPAPGMVVVLDADHIGQMRVASTAYDKAVAGIISGANGIAPGITLRQKGTVADGAFPVAGVGRVWCYCDADANGAITVGDMLTSSNTPGHAMRATDRERRDGAVIGKAMSPLSSGKGLVLVLVSLK